MFNRVFFIVLDACGVGELPDAAAYGDAGANTLGHVAEAVGGLRCPHLEALGLGKIIPVQGLSAVVKARGGYGKMAEQSVGKDSTTGHWELGGLVTTHPFPVYPAGFPASVIHEFHRRTGYDVLGNKPASGTVIINELGDEHLATGKLIVYTSADSVFQIAAHIDKIPLPELYRVCEIAREMLVGEDGVSRVIARPFVGESGEYTRTPDRRDYSLPPPGPTIIDRVQAAGIPTIGVGKIGDLFAEQGLDEIIHTKSNKDGMKHTFLLAQKQERGFVFVNLVEFDMLWGHRNDPVNFARALEAFDQQLGELLPLIKPADLLLISADHGCDPTMPSTDHSREYVPILAHGPRFARDVSLGIRATFADAAATVAEAFQCSGTGAGSSFLARL